MTFATISPDCSSAVWSAWRRAAITAIIAATGKTVPLYARQGIARAFVRLGDYEFTWQQAARIVRKYLMR